MGMGPGNGNLWRLFGGEGGGIQTLDFMTASHFEVS
jgi:hypothetical protein